MNNKKININSSLKTIVSNFRMLDVDFSGTKGDANKIIEFAYFNFSKMPLGEFFFPMVNYENFKREFEKIFGEMNSRSKYTSETLNNIFSTKTININWVIDNIKEINTYVGHDILSLRGAGDNSYNRELLYKEKQKTAFLIKKVFPKYCGGHSNMEAMKILLGEIESRSKVKVELKDILVVFSIWKSKFVSRFLNYSLSQRNSKEMRALESIDVDLIPEQLIPIFELELKDELRTHITKRIKHLNKTIAKKEMERTEIYFAERCAYEINRLKEELNSYMNMLLYFDDLVFNF